MLQIFSKLASSRTALTMQRVRISVALSGAQWSYPHKSFNTKLTDDLVLHVSRYTRFTDDAQMQDKFKQFEGFVRLAPVKYRTARFRFAIFDSAEHAQAALEKIQAQPLEGPPCPLHVRFYNAPDSDVKKGSPSDTLYFGQLSPKVKVVDVEALLKQFPGFVSLDQDNIFWFAKFDTAENATAAKESIQKAPDFPSRPWRVMAGKFSNREDRSNPLPSPSE